MGNKEALEWLREHGLTEGYWLEEEHDTQTFVKSDGKGNVEIKSVPIVDQAPPSAS